MVRSWSKIWRWMWWNRMMWSMMIARHGSINKNTAMWWSDNPSTKYALHLYLYLSKDTIYTYTMNSMHKCTNLTNNLVSFHPPSIQRSHLELKEELLKLFVGVLGHPIDLTQKWSQAERLWMGLNGGEEYWNIWHNIYIYIRRYIYINRSINEWYLYIIPVQLWYYNNDIIILHVASYLMTQ